MIRHSTAAGPSSEQIFENICGAVIENLKLVRIYIHIMHQDFKYLGPLRAKDEDPLSEKM